MSHFFGLYFGNTNMCIAVCRNGKTEVIANSAGDRLTPSFAAYTNDEIYVGIAAKQFMLRNVDDIMTCVKCLLLDRETNSNSKLKAYDVLIMLLRSMVGIARSYCHESDVPVVITVPLTFSIELQKTVEKAAIEAGFRVLRLVSEPAAAMLAYELEQATYTCNCLVYRLGGTSSDATVFNISGGIYRVLASIHSKDIGGNIFTRKLANFVAAEFSKMYKVDVMENRRSNLKLHAASETCKHSLSIMRSAQCFVESIYDGIDLNINVSQARLESLITTEFSRCFETILEALTQSSLNISDINKIVLCGGSCKIPKLQQFLIDKFPQSTVLTNISPDETIAVGASKQASLISQTMTDQDCYINTLTNAVFLKTEGSTHVIPLFSEGIPIPASSQVTFSIGKIFPLQVCEQLNGNEEFKILARFIPSSDNLDIKAEVTSSHKLKLTCTDIVTGSSNHYVI